jgi:drug/metabolite transporter (DMT)-like permease
MAAIIGLSIALMFIWGTAYTMVSVGVRTVSPIWLVSSRCVIGAVLVTLWALYRGHKFPPLRDSRWRWYGLLGFMGMVLPFWLFSKGQITIDSGLTSIIAGTMPLMTIILSHFFAHEPLSKRKAFGFFIGFCGIAMLFLPDDLSLSLIADWRAQMLLVGAAFCYAVTTVTAKRAPDTPPSLGAAMMLIAAAIMSTIAAVYSGVPDSLPPAQGLWMIAGLGIGSTAIGNILFLYVIKRMGPSTLAKINYFPPIISVAAGVLILGEPFTYKIVLAFVIIVIGLIIARSGSEGFGFKWPKSTR